MRRAIPLSFRRAVIATLVLAAPAAAQLTRESGSSPTAISDAEFWRLFTTMSETGGTFASENFVSNEMTFQHPIPTLQKTVRAGDVYLGVGPEQNFTYIANLKPRLAFIFDIRRQNAMAHLMYKAVFELSPTRGDFVGRLFSRPLAGRVAPTARVDDLFAVATAAQRSDSAFTANQRAIFATLVDKHKFVLTPGDSAAIEHLLQVFYEAGPDINYGYRLGRYGTSSSTYPTYGTIQTRTNADSVQMAFLASEDNYRAIRDMQVRNLIVPVVGDFAGPKAIRAVGDYLKGRKLTVQAFYLSNVEQYLFQNGVAAQFYENVATLPIDTTSTFIRSVPPGGGMMGGGGSFVVRSFTSGSGTMTINGSLSNSVMMYDSAGTRWIRMVQDSGGVTISRLYRDSSGVLALRQADTSRTPARVIQMPNPAPWAPQGLTAARGPVTMMMGGGLASGIAPIGKTLESFRTGGAATYNAIIGMTKLDGWR